MEKKDVYVLITRENKDSLYEISDFVTNWEYDKIEKEIYKEDIGKIETANCVFRFRYHNNVDMQIHDKKDAILHLTCLDCGNMDTVFISKAKDWKCPFCNLQV